METRGLKAHTHIWGHGGASWRRALTKWSFWGGPGWVQNGSTFFCATGARATNTCVLFKKIGYGDRGPNGTWEGTSEKIERIGAKFENFELARANPHDLQRS